MVPLLLWSKLMLCRYFSFWVSVWPIQCIKSEPYAGQWYDHNKCLHIILYVPKIHLLHNFIVINTFNSLFQLNNSTDTRVSLINMQRELSDYYRCEVVADYPKFYTLMGSSYLVVVGKSFELVFKSTEVTSDQHC